jgi:4-hydroxy-3-polyprenylbenzoate decarboxylase/2,5-furandicarboxylate decarboxylase 1
MPKEQAIYCGKVGIDATRKHAYPPRSMPSRDLMNKAVEIWCKYGLPSLMH